MYDVLACVQIHLATPPYVCQFEATSVTDSQMRREYGEANPQLEHLYVYCKMAAIYIVPLSKAP